MKIKKAVIPAAGLGTRFMPATTSIPKEMFPIVDKPILLYIVEEIIASGISEVVLVLGPNKQATEQFFSSYDKAKVTIVRQDKPLGLGHAVLCAEPAIGAEPFALLLGDEVTAQRPGREPAIGQLCKVFSESGKSAVAVMEVAQEDVKKYGIIAAEAQGPNRWAVLDVVEKPEAADAPSRLALPGRYVFDAAIFEHLRGLTPGKNGEIQLTDAMAGLAKSQGMLALTLDADRYDAGDKFGYIQANIEMGLKHPETGDTLNKYLRHKFGGNS